MTLIHPDLLRLPVFTIKAIETDGDVLTFEGTFNFFTDFYEVNVCNGVSCLYDPPIHYAGNVVRFERESLTAVFVTWTDERHHPNLGHRFCWLHGSYQPYHLNFLMEPRLWQPQNYTDPSDHDHCLICGRHICGWTDCPQYRNELSYHCEEAGWVCNACFNLYLARNSLAFIVPEDAGAA